MVEISLSKQFVEALCTLKQACLRCWAIEFSDIYPKREYSYLASEELRKQGNPPCRCEGEARLEFIKSRIY